MCRCWCPSGERLFTASCRATRPRVDCLKEETTEEAIVAKMCEKYDAPQAVLAADVREILDTLRSIHALEE